jgi:sulfur carrier protein ThiS
MFTTLVALSKTKQPSFDVDWREGMTVAEIVAAEGFSGQDAEAIAAIVNSEQSDFDRTLHDGDEVEFIVNLQGGAGVDSAVENPARRVDTPSGRP